MTQPTVVTGTAVVMAITREEAAPKAIPPAAVVPKPPPAAVVYERIVGPKAPPAAVVPKAKLGSCTVVPKPPPSTRDIIAYRERATARMAAAVADAATMQAPEVSPEMLFDPSIDPSIPEMPPPPESESSLSGEFEDWNMLRDLPHTAPPESGSSFSGEAEEWDGTRDWPPSPSSKPRDSGSTEQVAAEGLDVGAADAGVERTVWRCSGREFVREWRSTSVAPMNGRGKSDGPGTDTMMRAPT